jgi:Kef-type K+ transport system membrane component KefB
MNAALGAGMLIVLGFLGSRLVRRLKLPAVTGYLVMGIVLGPSVANMLTKETSGQLSHVVTPLALGIIAYMIGGSLPLSTLKGLRRNIAFITLAEGTFAWVFVLVLVTFVAPLVLPSVDLGFTDFLAMGIIIGGISLATAPAVTMAIINETKARGPLTTTLLGVIALDDGLAIIAYAFAVGIGASLLGAVTNVSPVTLVLTELGHIGLSVVLGGVCAFVILGLAHFTTNRREYLALVLGVVVISAELAAQFDLFPLIANMAMGFVVVNREKPSQDLIGVVHDIQELVFVLFFALAGSHLDLGIIGSAGTLAGLIVLGRSGGKVLGAWVGATASHAPSTVRKYLGMALMPKAGVTVGLTLLVVETPELHAISSLLVSAVLASTLINELFTPALSKLALVKAGESHRDENERGVGSD